MCSTYVTALLPSPVFTGSAETAGAPPVAAPGCAQSGSPLYGDIVYCRITAIYANN